MATLCRHVEHDLPAPYVQARRVAAKALAAAGDMAAADAPPPANPYRLAELLTDNWYPTGTRDVRCDLMSRRETVIFVMFPQFPLT